MEEKRTKRWRPSLTAYRVLEFKNERLKSELESQIEGTGVILRESYGWRKKYRDLVSMFENCKTHSKHGEETFKDEYKLRLEYQNRCTQLEKSNSLMEEELQRLRKANGALEESNMIMRTELNRIKSRGFWERLFDR